MYFCLLLGHLIESWCDFLIRLHVTVVSFAAWKVADTCDSRSPSLTNRWSTVRSQNGNPWIRSGRRASSSWGWPTSESGCWSARRVRARPKTSPRHTKTFPPDTLPSTTWSWREAASVTDTPSSVFLRRGTSPSETGPTTWWETSPASKIVFHVFSNSFWHESSPLSFGVALMHHSSSLRLVLTSWHVFAFPMHTCSEEIKIIRLDTCRLNDLFTWCWQSS